MTDWLHFVSVFKLSGRFFLCFFCLLHKGAFNERCLVVMHVNGSNRGILELDLTSVMGNDDEKNALGMVKSLDLSCNELSHISNMQPLTALTVLDLHKNRISKLVGLPLGLTRLNVAHNQLTTLEGIAALPFLAELDISHNRIVSLSGLPRLSPLAVLHAGHNRIANLAGIEVVNKLQVLHLDFNYLCTADDVRPLNRLPQTLKTLSLRGNPITELGDYHTIIRSIVGSVLTLDGATLRQSSGRSQQQQQGLPPAGPGSNTSTGSGRRPSNTSASPGRGNADHSLIVEELPRHDEADDHNASQASRTASVAQQGDLSFDGLATKAENRRHDLTEQLKRVQRDLSDTRLMLDQERRECKLMHQKNTKLEQQLAEARRVLADELHTVSDLREANHKLEDELLIQKRRAEKAVREYNYANQKLRALQRKKAEEIETLCVNHDNTIAQLEEQIRSNVHSTRKLAKEDTSLVREVEALRRKVSHLTAQNRTLQGEVSRLESEAASRYPGEDDEFALRRSVTGSQPRGRRLSDRLAGDDVDAGRPSSASRSPSKGRQPRREVVSGEDDDEDDFEALEQEARRRVDTDDEDRFDDPFKKNPYRPTSAPSHSTDVRHEKVRARRDVVEGEDSDGQTPGKPHDSSAVDFAQQLKSWLLSEIQTSGQLPPGTVDAVRDEPNNGMSIANRNTTADDFYQRGSPRRPPEGSAPSPRKHLPTSSSWQHTDLDLRQQLHQQVQGQYRR